MAASQGRAAEHLPVTEKKKSERGPAGNAGLSDVCSRAQTEGKASSNI